MTEFTCENCHKFDSNNDQDYAHEYAKDSLGRCGADGSDIMTLIRCHSFSLDLDTLSTKKQVFHIEVEVPEHEDPWEILKEMITTGVDMTKETYDWEHYHINKLELTDRNVLSDDLIYAILKAYKVDTSYGVDYGHGRWFVDKELQK